MKSQNAIKESNRNSINLSLNPGTILKCFVTLGKFTQPFEVLASSSVKLGE